MLPSERRWYVYALCEPETLEVRYIGKTCDMASRFRAHWAGTSTSDLVRAWIAELGMPPPIVELASFPDEQSALQRETEVIQLCANPRLLNRRKTGDIGPQPGGFSGLGQRIREARVALAITQGALARAIGVGQSRLSQVEQGRIDNLTLSQAVRLARALGTTVEYLVTGEDVTPPIDTSASAPSSAAVVSRRGPSFGVVHP